MWSGVWDNPPIPHSTWSEMRRLYSHRYRSREVPPQKFILIWRSQSTYFDEFCGPYDEQTMDENF